MAKCRPMKKFPSDFVSLLGKCVHELNFAFNSGHFFVIGSAFPVNANELWRVLCYVDQLFDGSNVAGDGVDCTLPMRLGGVSLEAPEI